MIVLWRSDNHPVCTGNFIVQEAQLETFVPFFILVKHWNFIDFKNFQFKFDFKLATNEFQEFSVI